LRHDFTTDKCARSKVNHFPGKDPARRQWRQEQYCGITGQSWDSTPLVWQLQIAMREVVRPAYRIQQTRVAKVLLEHRLRSWLLCSFGR
jgi:hypothetical protein